MEAAVHISTDEYNWQSLPCSAHRLQLCVLSINAIDRLIAAAKKIVGHFSHSVVATVALKEKQNQMNNTDAKKLINSCATRWNSTYEMLECLLKLCWPIVAVLSDELVTKRSDRYLDFKTEQWKLVEDLVSNSVSPLHFLVRKKMFLSLQYLPLYMAYLITLNCQEKSHHLTQK